MKARDLRRRGLRFSVPSIVREVAQDLRSRSYEPDLEKLRAGVIAGYRSISERRRRR
jgi:hypothetical protein